MSMRRGSDEGPSATSYKGWVRGKKERIQELKKLVIPRKDRILSFVVGIERD